MLIRGVTLPNAEEGIKFYLQPDFERLTDAEVKLFVYSDSQNALNNTEIVLKKNNQPAAASRTGRRPSALSYCVFHLYSYS